VHYLFALWDGGGTVPPELGVARRLILRGHTSTVLADPTLADDVAVTGAEFRSWRRAPHRRSQAPDDDLLKDWECRSPAPVLGRLLDRLIAGPAAVFADEVRAAYRDRPGDAVVASGPLLGALAAAESLRVPAVALMSNIYNRPAPGLPPFGTGLRPAGGPVTRIRDRALDAVVTRMWNRGLPALNAARGSLGLPALGDLWEQLDRAARVLVLTSPAFDLPASSLPENVRYVGPVLDDPAWAEAFDPPAGTEPLVLVGFSSTRMRGQVEVLRRVVAALSTLPVRAVVTTGLGTDPADVPGTERVSVVRSAPHGVLLRSAAAMVTHAGHGTLLKTLAAGVPAVCLPMGRDQRDNVVRAERHGVVVRLRPTASAERIAAAVRQILDDPSFRQAAQVLGSRLRTDAGSSRLVDELETVAARHRRRPEATA
jgi:MGT family glycosyltransferase